VKIVLVVHVIVVVVETNFHAGIDF